VNLWIPTLPLSYDIRCQRAEQGKLSCLSSITCRWMASCCADLVATCSDRLFGEVGNAMWRIYVYYV